MGECSLSELITYYTDNKTSTNNISPTNSNKNNINIDQLNGRVCYFSLSGNLSLDAYSRIKLSQTQKGQRDKRLKQEVQDRLYFALLMFDTVVLHCSDPLRSKVILDILEENIDFIKSGRIVFLASSSINNYKKDFETYVHRKIKEYEEGYHSKEEAESLKAKHIDKIYYSRVIEILDSSPIIVRKSNKSNNSFKELVINDLNKNYNEIVDASSENSFILSMNLSLQQLLNAQLYKTDDKYKSKSGHGKMVFPCNLVEKIIEDITNSLEQDVVIARTAIEDFFKQEINSKKINKTQKNILDVISMRMDVLYCLMNCGDQLVLEFHPYYEQKSIYRMDCFFELLRFLLDKKTEVTFEHDMIKKIIDSRCVETLRLYYLSIMADTHEQMKSTVISGDSRHLYKRRCIDYFKNIMDKMATYLTKNESIETIKNIMEEYNCDNN